MAIVPGLVSPPFVVALLSVTLTLSVVFVFVLLLLRTGWSGYRGLLAGAVFTVLAFWALRGLLFAGLNVVYRTFGPGNLDAIFWGGAALSLVAIFVLAVMIQRTAKPIWNKEA